MSTVDLVVVAAVVFFAAFVQVISGFGFGLLSVPLMTIAIAPKEAVVVSTLIGMSITSWQAWHQRADADRVLVRRMTIAAYFGMPLGLLVFVTVDDTVLRFLLGIAVLVTVVLLAMRISFHNAGPGLDVGAGFVAGVLNTSLSTNGPPLVFALQARHLGPVQFRGTISAVFMLSNIASVALFVAADKVTHDGLVATAVALPSMFLGQVAGYPVRRHVHGDRFRNLVLVLLTVAGVSAIAGALASG